MHSSVDLLHQVNASSDETGNKLACCSDRHAIISAAAPETHQHSFRETGDQSVTLILRSIPKFQIYGQPSVSFDHITFLFRNPQIVVLKSFPHRPRINEHHLWKLSESERDVLCAWNLISETCTSFTCASRDLYMRYQNIIRVRN
jgi:hypothetical protein